jgi:drug/metabolite transporter (DMT)-like permease
VDQAAQDVPPDAIGTQPCLPPWRRFQEFEVLLIGRDGCDEIRQDGRCDDQDRDDQAAEDDGTPEGAPDPPAKARRFTLSTRGHEHRFACELQRGDARRARRGVSRPAPPDGAPEAQAGSDRWPGWGMTRVPWRSACATDALIRSERRARQTPAIPPGRPPSVLTWADGGALLAVLVWGVSFPVMKALMTVMDPLALMLVLWLVALAVLGTILRRTGAWQPPARQEIPGLLTVGLGGFTLNQILYSWGLHLTTASHSGLIFTVTPLVVFVLSQALGQVRMRRLDVFGLALGMGGAVLIIGWPASGAAGGASVLGDLLTVGAAITWGVWTVLAAPIVRRRGTLDGTFWISLTGTLGLVPFALPGLVTQDWTLPWWVWVGILYSGAAGGALGSVLWYAAVRRLGAARTGIYANMESFFAVLASVLLLGEEIAMTSIVGGLAVIAGVLLTRRPG